MKKFLFITLFFLGSCSFLGGYSPSSTFYMMNSQGLEAVSSKKISVGVAKVNVPDLLNKQQMVVYDKDSRKVNILEFERWGELLPDVLQNTVTNDLMAYLPDSYIKSVEYATDTLDYTVKIKINKLEAYKEDKVILSAWWQIENSKGKILARRQSTCEIAVKGEKMNDLVAAQNAAVNQLSLDIALQLDKL